MDHYGGSMYNTYSLTRQVRDEIETTVQEYSLSNRYLRKEYMDEMIQRCMRDMVGVTEDEMVTIVNPAITSSEHDPTSVERTSEDIQVSIDMLKNDYRSNLIVENFEILEHRITNLEERVSTVLNTLPKLRLLQSKKYKINTQVIREEVRKYLAEQNSLLGRLEAPKIEEVAQPICDVTDEPTEEPQPQPEPEPEPEAESEELLDELYFEQRQRSMNMLYFKKSSVTMGLNKRTQFNPAVKPNKYPYPIAEQGPLQSLRKAVFIDWDIDIK